MSDKGFEKYAVEGPQQARFAYSPAIVTRGGRQVWLAGHVGYRNDDGSLLQGGIEEQTYKTFSNMEKTLAKVGGTLKDVVTMTAFLTDAAYIKPMNDIRAKLFGPDYPASASIVIAGLADPAIMLEIQAVAVIAD